MDVPSGDPLRAYVEGVVRELLGPALDALLAERGLQPHGEFLSTAEAAAYAKVTPDTIRRWKDAGSIEAHTAGRELRFRRDDIDTFMRTRKRRKRKTCARPALSPETLAMKSLGLDPDA